MGTKPFNLRWSLLACFAVLVASSGAMAAIRINNKSRSYADAYNQVNEQRNAVMSQQQIAAMAATNGSGNSVATEPGAITANATDVNPQLEKCSMIYPNGEFVWDRAGVGSQVGGRAGCAAVVELRAIGAGLNGDDLVLARANLAAGDSMKCNIYSFPESAMFKQAVESIEFPADSEPTIEDVKQVMNQEQKQHAGLKIAAGTVVAAIAGNIAGDGAMGSDALLGTNKEKLVSTAIGAAGGAAVMAGNVYAGKVAGDMILSTGVNAVAGGLVGNIAASGDSVMRIEKCEYGGQEYDCLWGVLEETTDLTGEDVYVSTTNVTDFVACTDSACRFVDVAESSVVVPGYEIRSVSDRDKTPLTLVDILNEGGGRIEVQDKSNHLFCFKDGKMQAYTGGCEQEYVKLMPGARSVSKRTPVMAVGVKDKPFGWKKKDWQQLSMQYPGAPIVARVGMGQAGTKDMEEQKLVDVGSRFVPVYLSSDDGGIIDLDNKARLGDTLTGAGVGGAMGAFTAYQGAQSDIENRWVTAVREYKDSLQKVYCATGNRFLSYYNDAVIIPNMSE